MLNADTLIAMFQEEDKAEGIEGGLKVSKRLSLAKQMLSHFGIRVIGYVVQLGGIDLPLESANDFDSMLDQRTQSAIYSLCPSKDPEVISLIDQTAEDGDTLGGIVETKVTGLPFGLGTHAQWDKKLDGKLAQAVMAVQAIKGVEIGLGFQSAALPGSKVMILFSMTQQRHKNLISVLSAPATMPAVWKPA